jgi:hypothetical protein
MKRLIAILVGSAAILIPATVIRAQDQLVPAGTLLQCTLDEPNFSSATAAVGDPVLCHLRTMQSFGRPVFPRGSMLGGHLEADKEPGHFVGKGYLKITFDRIILPNGDLPVPAKVIQARGYKVDKDGAIDGKGHATRDVVEWMFPPLWPWKVLTLPARGPRPTLKGEEPMELRLMDDIVVPRFLAQVPHPDRPPFAQHSSYNGTSQSGQAPAGAMQLASVTSVAPAAAQPINLAPSAQRCTKLVLNSNQVIDVAKYYRQDDLLVITDTQGRSGSIEIANINWAKTAEMTGSFRFVETPQAIPQLVAQQH